MKQKYSIVILVALLICSFSQAQIKTPGQIIAEVKTKITQISVEDFKSKMESEDKFVLLDVRTEKEYLAGHIKNAVWLPRGFVEFKIQKLIEDPEAEIIEISDISY